MEAAAAAAAPAVAEAYKRKVEFVLGQAERVLSNISAHHYDNEAYVAYWNDWKARDGRAHVERTHDNGRWSYAKRTLGIENGRWYCCLKTDAARAKGLRLDGEGAAAPVQPAAQPAQQGWSGAGGWAGNQRMQSRRAVCPHNHALQPCMVPPCGAGCDSCGHMLMPGMMTMGCRWCDFDLCGRCCT
jgi:hypothetical protein